MYFSEDVPWNLLVHIEGQEGGKAERQERPNREPACLPACLRAHLLACLPC
jgi:hypothetical protein